MLRANWTAPADAFVLPGPDTNFVDITTPRVDEYAAVAAATAASVPSCLFAWPPRNAQPVNTDSE